jgi:hypothetical protein
VPKKIIGTALLIGGGTALGAVLYGILKSRSTVQSIQDAMNGSGEKVALRLTGYWPFTARPDEVKMEGGLKDRKGNPLHTVEDFFAGKSDHVSLSGDYTIWPYGQKVLIPWGDRTVVGRVTDTGSHFHGAGKLIRAVGYEPMDVCVYSSATKIPNVKVDARIVPGDNFEKGKAVAVNQLQQNVSTSVVGKLATLLGYGQAVVGASPGVVKNGTFFSDIVDPLDCLS